LTSEYLLLEGHIKTDLELLFFFLAMLFSFDAIHALLVLMPFMQFNLKIKNY